MPFSLSLCVDAIPTGSGKTTLLNHLLSDKTHGMKFAVIENEFGEVGIDEKSKTKQQLRLVF